MEIAITGGAGFIGRHLVHTHLERGDNVRLLTRRNHNRSENLEIFIGDLQDETSDLTKFVNNADILYHCAGELNDQSRMEALHVFGTRRLAIAAEGCVGRWVQLSSVGAYGRQRTGCINEETAENPIGTYEVAKVQSDHIVTNIAESAGMEYAILRPSIVFGEGMTNRSLYQMIEMVRRGLFFYIGNPGSLMNYIHVTDVARALLLCGLHKNANSKTFIISDYMKLEEMITAISQGLGVEQRNLRFPEWFVRTLTKILQLFPGFPLSESRIDALTVRAYYDASRIKQELGFHNSIELMDAFREISTTTATK